MQWPTRWHGLVLVAEAPWIAYHVGRTRLESLRVMDGIRKLGCGVPVLDVMFLIPVTAGMCLILVLTILKIFVMVR